MSLRNKLVRPVALFIANHFLAGTHFFGAKRTLLRAAGVKIGEDTRIVCPLRIGTVAQLEIGSGCWLGKNLFVDGNGSVAIGDNVDIGPQVTFATGGHEVGTADRRAGKGTTARQSVGDGSWVGTHSIIVGNADVGSGCVVAAGAVVTKSLGDNILIAGVPAAVKKALS